MSDLRSFHELASFYKRFVKDFSIIVALLTAIVKKDIGFKWGEEQEHAFKTSKDKLCSTSVLCLSYFSKNFEIECDDSGIGIETVLI